MGAPILSQDQAFKHLRVGDFEMFAQCIEGRDVVDFSGCDLRGTDFRKADLSRLVLRNAYLRDADFRGCDLRHMDLEGASLHGAKIGGAYFPQNVTASELRMSLRHGTRIRISTST